MSETISREKLLRLPFVEWVRDTSEGKASVVSTKNVIIPELLGDPTYGWMYVSTKRKITGIDTRKISINLSSKDFKLETEDNTLKKLYAAFSDHHFPFSKRWDKLYIGADEKTNSFLLVYGLAPIGIVNAKRFSGEARSIMKSWYSIVPQSWKISIMPLDSPISDNFIETFIALQDLGASVRESIMNQLLSQLKIKSKEINFTQDGALTDIYIKKDQVSHLRNYVRAEEFPVVGATTLDYMERGDSDSEIIRWAEVFPQATPNRSWLRLKQSNRIVFCTSKLF